jgi:hypothetical protein
VATIPIDTVPVGPAPAHQAVDQLHRGVMMDLQPLG